MTITEIKKMSIVERLKTMEELWDSLCHEENEIESPEWHEDILGKRKNKIKKDKAKFISLNEIKARTHK